MNFSVEDWGTEKLVRLSSPRLRVSLLSFGARTQSIEFLKDADTWQHLVLGFESLEEYHQDSSYIGATCGRVANRIGGATFTLDGEQSSLPCNDAGKHCLHGGDGFHSKSWKLEDVSAIAESTTAVFSLISPSQEEGFPGELAVKAMFSIIDIKGESVRLEVCYQAVAVDRPTVCNVVNHNYWNLSTPARGQVPTIFEHNFSINADFFTPVDDESIPTGEILSVAGTPFDFRKVKRVLPSEAPGGKGFDHNFVVRGPHTLRPFASVSCPSSAVKMDVFASYPGAQFYTGNFLPATTSGDRTWGIHSGFCLEPQFFPDSPNKHHFPSTRLEAGEKFEQKVAFHFSVC